MRGVLISIPSHIRIYKLTTQSVASWATNFKVSLAIPNEARAFIEAEAALHALDWSSARRDIGRIGGWKKEPDIPLATHVARQRKRRSHLESLAPRTATPDKSKANH